MPPAAPHHRFPKEPRTGCVLVTATTFGLQDPALKSELERAVGEVRYSPERRPLTATELAGRVKGIDAWIAGLDRDRRVGHCGGRPPEADRPLRGGGRPRGPGGRNPPRDRRHQHAGRQLGRRGRADDRADAGARAADLPGEPRRAGRPVAPHRGGRPGRQDRGPGGVRGHRPRDGAATGGVRVPGPRRGPLREPGGDCRRAVPARPPSTSCCRLRTSSACTRRPPPRPRAW